MRYIISILKSKILYLLYKEDKPLCVVCIAKMIGEGESEHSRNKVAVSLTQLKNKNLITKTAFLCEGVGCTSRARSWKLTEAGKQWAKVIVERGLVSEV
jgi:hypothetical protein